MLIVNAYWNVFINTRHVFFFIIQKTIIQRQIISCWRQVSNQNARLTFRYSTQMFYTKTEIFERSYIEGLQLNMSHEVKVSDRTTITWPVC